MNPRYTVRQSNINGETIFSLYEDQIAISDFTTESAAIKARDHVVTSIKHKLEPHEREAYDL